MLRRRRTVVLGAASFVFGLMLVTAPFGEWATALVNDAVEAAVPLAVTVPAARRAARGSWGRQAATWWLVAAGALCWGLGQVVYSWYDLGASDSAPFPSMADVGFLGGAGALLAAVLVYPSPSLPAVGRLRAALDGALSAIAVLYLSADLVVHHLSGEVEGSSFEQALSLAYPAADLVLLAVAIALLVRAAEPRRGPVPLIVMAAASLSIADVGFAWSNTLGGYDVEQLTDIGWPVGFALLALAASRSNASGIGRSREMNRSTFEWIGPSAPVLPALVSLGHALVVGRDLGPLVGSLGIAVVGVLSVRQFAIVLENRELNSGLADTVAELRAREDELRFKALHDPLTSLANRALFRDRLEHKLARREQRRGCVLYIDLDDFKTVNDSLGHEAGDRLLVSFAQRLRGCVRAGDTVARFGGDEFGVLAETADLAQGTALAWRIRQALSLPFVHEGRELPVRASIGLVVIGDGDEADSLLAEADMAMYAAKAAGKGGCSLYRPELRARVDERLDLGAGIRAAAARGELELVYQPVLRTRDLTVAGHEALLRWNHPTRGLLTPDRFLGLAEESGAIVDIGWWAVESACRAAASWPPPAGPPDRLEPAGPRVMVNIHPSQLRQPDAVERLGLILRDAGLDPARLELEIAEPGLVTDDLGDWLGAVRGIGVRIAIDDFGTGQSALSYFNRVEADTVKIDRSFVARVGEPGASMAREDLVVSALAQFGATTGLDIVAEGVETSAQLERIRELGCGYAQGFVFGHPCAVPASQAEVLRRIRTDLAGARSQMAPAAS